jgi:hypothetical protein
VLNLRAFDVLQRPGEALAANFERRYFKPLDTIADARPLRHEAALLFLVAEWRGL